MLRAVAEALKVQQARGPDEQGGQIAQLLAHLHAQSEAQAQMQAAQQAAMLAALNKPKATSYLKDMASKEIEALTTDFEPHHIDTWLAEALPRCSRHAADLPGILAMPEAAWSLCKDQPRLASQNEWAASQLGMMVSRKSDRGANFMKGIVREEPAALRCARTFIKRAKESRMAKPGGDGRERYKEFLAKLQPGKLIKKEATTEQIVGSLNDLRDMHTVLPEQYKGRAHDLVRHMLTLLPNAAQGAAMGRREQLEIELEEAETKELGEAPWSFKELSNIIAVNLKGRVVPSTIDFQSNWSERQPRVGGRPGGGGGGGGGGGASGACSNCGKEGHYWQKCKTVCVAACGEPSCPGTRKGMTPKGVCVVKMPWGQFPAKGQLLNALGMPYPPPVYNRLLKAHKKHHNKLEANEHDEEEEEEAETHEEFSHSYAFACIEVEEAEEEFIDTSSPVVLQPPFMLHPNLQPETVVPVPQGLLAEMLEEVPAEDLSLFFDQVPGPSTWVLQNLQEDTPEAAGLSLPTTWPPLSWRALLAGSEPKDERRRITFEDSQGEGEGEEESNATEVEEVTDCEEVIELQV